MRVLCVGRHAYLSEHLSRYFRGLGAECEPVVGSAAVASAAERFEPHLVVSDSSLLTPSLLEAWRHTAVLAETPVLAVSLTRRPDDAGPERANEGGVVYLPALDRAQALALLAGAYRRRGVQSPPQWRLDAPVVPPATIR
jgi:hypothetical protein